MPSLGRTCTQAGTMAPDAHPPPRRKQPKTRHPGCPSSVYWCVWWAPTRQRARGPCQDADSCAYLRSTLQESWEGDQPKVTQVAERGPRGTSAARSTQSLRAGATARPEALPTAVLTLSRSSGCVQQAAPRAAPAHQRVPARHAPHPPWPGRRRRRRQGAQVTSPDPA